MATTPTLEWARLLGSSGYEDSRAVTTGLDGAISKNFAKLYLNPITGKDFHRL